MPLYECSNCHAVENTALTNYWSEHLGDGKPALCSECDPAIGTWHGEFEKRTVTQAGMVPDTKMKGMLMPVGGWK